MFWPFSSNSRTSVSEADLVDLRGKVAIVTGSNAGIGYSTVQFLARKGAKVYMAARSEAKALEAIRQLEAEDLWGGQVEWLRLDLSDMRQTKEAALEIFEKEKRLDILVNNAAMVVGPFKKTADGLLDIMVVNHISHFIFTMTLLPLMKQTSNESPLADVRIINVTSEVHQIVPPVTTFAGEGCLSHQYEESVMGYLRTYGYTKLANILFTKELQRRLSLEGFANIVCIAAHPGSVTTPGSQRFMGSIPYISWITTTLNSWFSYPQRAGAFTSVFAAASPEVKAEPEKYRGAYLIPVARIAKPSKNAQDERLAKELWETTEAKLKELSML
ncbi:NAD-binding protein [Agrocybe pediades]|nr:NAD-binding protein [Agrocybe pediades]